MANEWDAEGGADELGGVGALTNGNSDASGFAMSTSAPAGTAITFATAAAMDGLLGLNFTRTSGTATFYTQQLVGSTTATARKRQRVKFRFTSWPTDEVQLMNQRNSGNAQAGYMSVDTTGHLLLKDAVGVTKWTSAALSLNTIYRAELAVKPGSTTTTGAIDGAYYLNNSATPVETPALLTGQNCGTDPTVLYTRWGRGGDSWVGTYQLDSLAWDDGATGFIGPVPGGAPVSGRGVWVDATSSGGIPVKVSGATLTYTTPTTGWYLFTQAATSAVYSFNGQQVTIPALSTGTASVYAPRMFNRGTGAWPTT